MCGALGYADIDDFIRRGLGLDPALVDWAIRGLKALAPNKPIPFAKAVQLGKRGGDRRSEKARENQNDNISLKYGTAATYRLARLERDHPEVAQAYRAGELPSVAAAWRAAGLEKPKDRVGALVRAARKLTKAEFARLIEELRSL